MYVGAGVQGYWDKEVQHGYRCKGVVQGYWGRRKVQEYNGLRSSTGSSTVIQGLQE